VTDHHGAQPDHDRAQPDRAGSPSDHDGPEPQTGTISLRKVAKRVTNVLRHGPAQTVRRILGGPEELGMADLSAAAARDGISSVVDCAVYVHGVRQSGTMDHAEALALARRHRSGYVWLGLKEPGPAELTELAQIFGLHELAIEDAAKSGQRPKVEHYPGMTFATMRTARYVAHDELTEISEVVETGEMMMFIGDHFIITIRHGDACQLRPLRAELEQRTDLLAVGPWAVAYAVYDLVVDVLVDVATAIEEDVALAEDAVFARDTGRSKSDDPSRPDRRGADRDGTRIQRVYQLKRELMEFKGAVLPLQRPVANLANDATSEVPAELRRYFRDIHDHLTRTVDQVMYFDDVLNSVLQARLAQVSVDQNNDMRKIAAWAGMAAVWTSLAGVYGMNFDFMPELRWKYGYPVVLALMVGISLALYRAFRRSGWL